MLPGHGKEGRNVSEILKNLDIGNWVLQRVFIAFSRILYRPQL